MRSCAARRSASVIPAVDNAQSQCFNLACLNAKILKRLFLIYILYVNTIIIKYINIWVLRIQYWRYANLTFRYATFRYIVTFNFVLLVVSQMRYIFSKCFIFEVSHTIIQEAKNLLLACFYSFSVLVTYRQLSFSLHCPYISLILRWISASFFPLYYTTLKG